MNHPVDAVFQDTYALAEFVVAADRATLPPDVIDFAKRCTLDFIGAATIGRRFPWTAIVRGYAKDSTALDWGECTIIGDAMPSSPALAALVNGTAGHAFEIDDCHDESLSHPGVAVIPAALAVAENENLSGSAFLVSVVAGYEVMARVGLAVGAVSHMMGGFHPTGTLGVFGASAAAAKLLNANRDQLLDALGVSVSLAGGVMEFAMSGGMSKRLHAGRAAESGVLAAYLARRGFTGPRGALEGRYGFYNCFTDEPNPERLTAGLGEQYRIRETTFKQYCSCGDLHAAIDAIRYIVAKHGIQAPDVRRILVEGSSKLAAQNSMDGTTSVMAAQYSIEYAMAGALLFDMCDPSSYDEEHYSDPRIPRLQNLVEVRSAPEFDANYPHVIASRVTVKTSSGHEYSRTVNGAKGSIHDPMTQSEVEEKFRRIAAVSSMANASEVLSLVNRLDKVGSVRALGHLLRGRADRLA